MTILNQLEKVMSDMYAFCNKMYAAIEKSDKDSQIADLVTQADSMDEKFVAEQIVRARNFMDETYRQIEYMNLPILLDGHLKKEKDGTYSLCGKRITQRVGIEYVHEGRWKIGLIQKAEGKDEYTIVDDNIKEIEISLENLRVRTREKIRYEPS